MALCLADRPWARWQVRFAPRPNRRLRWCRPWRWWRAAKVLWVRSLSAGADPAPVGDASVKCNVHYLRTDNERAAEIAAAKVVDYKNVFACDVSRVFLNPDGTIRRELMPDDLHPSPRG